MDVHITLLGGFAVSVDGVAVPADAWRRRHAAALVKLLALSHGHRLHREQVVDALWADAPMSAAGPRLHKAAHYARRALGGDESTSVVLRNDLVALLPDAHVTVDAEEFRARGTAALTAGSAAQAAEALERYGGPLLPDDVYEPWAEEHRESLRLMHLDLLRLAERWEDLLAVEPTDEQAHLALVRDHAGRGDTRAALRQLERLDQALRRELGTVPSAEAQRLRTELEARAAGEGGHRPPPTPSGRTLVGRREAGDRVRERMAQADAGHGTTLLVTGPPGVGKSAVLDMAVALAGQRGWRIGRGTASAVEGPWPYAPVLEALGDLCRHHPVLLDGLDDNYRTEIDRALSGREVTWSGETAHQRLFVAAAELLRLAAAGHGLLLVVDDVHEADGASLRLLHYLARCVVSEPVLLLLAHRSGDTGTLRELRTSLLSRGIGALLELAPLKEETTRRLLTQTFPTLDDASVRQIVAVSGGLPFSVLELGRVAAAGASGAHEPVQVSLVAALPEAVQHTFERVAMLGATFSTDELLAVADTSDAEAYQHLDLALEALVVEPAESGYRFRHTLVRQAFLDTLPPRDRPRTRAEVATALAKLGAPPGRVAHQYLAAGDPGSAIPYVVPAVETAGALGAYRDALVLVDAVIDDASGADLAHLLARRGDLLMALGDPSAVAAYREAVPLTSGTEHRLVRARLARAACFAGDFDVAEAALEGLDVDGDAADGPILLARGNLAYFTGDIESAWAAASEARALLTANDPWHFVDLVGLQGLIAHQRGEWFERFRRELRRTQDRPGLAAALFDAHLCVAEYLLYGPVPYVEVIAMAEDLRRRASQAGALRGIAFATALIGEAALLMGDLPRAETELREAVDLHRDVDAAAGEAHSLQRLAEVRLAQGDPDEAETLLHRALPLARWSVISMHLLQRVYGTLITAAPDRVAARAMVDRAMETLGENDSCLFCDVMLEVPATIACADAGDLPEARRHLAAAEVSAARWEGSAWSAAVAEARAHVARASHDEVGFERSLRQAARLFNAAGQPLDATRCERSLASVAPRTTEPGLAPTR